MNYTVSPAGSDSKPLPGDFILCHRKGFASACIRGGERLRLRSGDNWSHAALCINETEIVEALTHGVERNPISVYRDIEYVVVQTNLGGLNGGYDAQQAVAFALSCVGQKYGFAIILGIGLRFLTPGTGLWFGMNGTEICSGLVGQSLVRGWANFPVNPSALTPADLALYYKVPVSPKHL